MNFYSFSNITDQALSTYSRITLNVDSVSLKFINRKINSCEFRVLLVSRANPIPERLDKKMFDVLVLVTLHKAWGFTFGHGRDQGNAWKTINRLSQIVLFSKSEQPIQVVRRLKSDPSGNSFCVFITGNEKDGLPLYELLSLSNLWQLERGNLVLHSAGVLHKGGLYLFAGPSGAGKSTVSLLSQQIGDFILDEDQVLLNSPAQGQYCADAWGYNWGPCEAPLRAIFRLHQDTQNRVAPLTQMETARLLLERHSEAMGDMLSDELLSQAFQLSSAVARQVPGYDLFFQKSPDFWKLIDAEFSVERE